MPNEKLIAKHMATLGISREEAILLITEDEAVDRMTSTKQIDGDLSDEQKKAKKKATQADRKKTVYKFDTKKERKANNAKRELIDIIEKALSNLPNCETEVTNIEREIIFHFEGVKYKVVLSAPRSQGRIAGKKI